MLILRFLQAASILYLCSLFIEMVACGSLAVGLEKGAPNIFFRNHTSSHGIRRTYMLYNQCSGRHVQIFGKVVDARGNSDSPHVNLSFVSVHVRHHPSAMNILVQRSGRYLCFNKKGKLIARLHGKKRLCLFKEDFSKYHYTVLQSLYNPLWFVGFNQNGKPLRANQYSKPKLRECFHFVKRNHSYIMEEPRWPGPPIKDPSKLEDLLTQRKKSRQSRKTSRRMPSR